MDYCPYAHIPNHHRGASHFLCESLDASPLACKPSTLNFAKGPCTTKKSDDSDDTRNGQGLEKIPGAVVQKEDSFHGDNGTEENAVRDWCTRYRLLQVREVGPKKNPLCPMLASPADR